MNEVTWFIRNDPLSGEYMYVIHNNIPYYYGMFTVVDVLPSTLSLDSIFKFGTIIKELDSYKNDERYIKLLLYIRKLDSKLYQELIK